MKIHYKTLTEKRKGDEPSIWKEVIENNNEYQIDYCCSIMKQAIKDRALRLVGIDLYLQIFRYEDIENYDSSLKHCPWCGVIIEPVEEYQAERVRYSAKISTKIIPAHTEKRYKEIRTSKEGDVIPHP